MHSMAPLYYLLVTFCLLLPASPMTFKLQRALPSAHGNGNGNGNGTHYLSNLRAHDFDRHRRILPTVFPFPVYGNGREGVLVFLIPIAFDDKGVALWGLFRLCGAGLWRSYNYKTDFRLWLSLGNDGVRNHRNHLASYLMIYYTKVPLGSPPKEFHVVIDTGSHVAWVSCGGCNSCPKTSSFPIQLNNFDPRSSSTSSAILCSDRLCRDGSHSHDAACDIGSNQCNFKVKYADGSGTSGHYFSDLMHFTGFAEGSVATDSSSRVVFG
ncbi:hypothetical protein RIF29_29440 [Crotalaria pallida]|uniref:Peptidase A1 domain-containing protein n=1 Tax=Crotalaria pallida TaxID=3830 RepID=A0AAN9EGR0_CROPI